MERRAVNEVASAAREVRLRDGSLVSIRPITPQDKELVRAGFERLSPTSRYRRFLTPMPRLSAAQLAYLTEVDHHDHEALIAIDPASGQGLGVARFVRDRKAPDTAEAAVTVVDDWQGRGLGTTLLGALTDRAREEGIDRFTCLVLAENRDMIQLLERLGTVVELERHPGTVKLAVDVPPPELGVGAQLGELLRAAASGVVRFVTERTAEEDRARGGGRAE